MGIYLKFLGILIILSGLLLGGLTLYYDQGYGSFEQKISTINKKYEKIGKELDGLVTKNIGSCPFFKQGEAKTAIGISLILGGILTGSFFLGLGVAVSLLKKISKKI